jgi:hypothetical protein
VGRRHRTVIAVAALLWAALSLAVPGPAWAAGTPATPAADPASVAIGWFDGCSGTVCRGWAHQDFAYPQASHNQLQVAIWVDGVSHEVVRISATEPAEPAVGGAYRWILTVSQLEAAGLPPGDYVVRPYAISVKPDGTPSFVNPLLPLDGSSNLITLPSPPTPQSSAVAQATPRPDVSTVAVTTGAPAVPAARRSGFPFVWVMLALGGAGLAALTLAPVVLTRDRGRRRDGDVGGIAEIPWDPFRP